MEIAIDGYPFFRLPLSERISVKANMDLFNNNILQHFHQYNDTHQGGPNYHHYKRQSMAHQLK